MSPPARRPAGLPPRLLALLPALLALALGSTGATAAERLTVRTSLDPLAEAGDPRVLRARGTAPRGARVIVRFYRGSTHLTTRRPKLRADGYSTGASIRRPGEYTVRVTARRRDGKELRVSAKLTYGPVAEAPSAPGNEP